MALLAHITTILICHHINKILHRATSLDPPAATWQCRLNFTAPTCAVTISGADGLPVELMDFYIEETSSAPNEGSQEAEATPGGKSTGPKP